MHFISAANINYFAGNLERKTGFFYKKKLKYVIKHCDKTVKTSKIPDKDGGIVWLLLSKRVF